MSRAAGRRLGASVLAAVLLACGSGPDAPDVPPGAGPAPDRAACCHPIVLVTLSALRPDVVGALGASPATWTPNVDALAAEADWVGTAVAASSAPVVALVSLMTGVSPWQHQVLSHAPSAPRPGIPLLAEVLGAAGYRTSARVPSGFRFDRVGLLQGFDDVAEIEPIEDAAARLEGLGAGGPELHWFHLREPSPPFERRDAELPRSASPAGLPDQVRAGHLLSYADPLVPLPAEEREAFRQLFGHEVAWADRQVGTLLDAVRASGAWDRAWVIVTASQGLELGEHAQALYAQNLGRESIEVPLVIKLPRSLRGSLAVADDVRVSQLRLWATLVESAGRRAAPVSAPSLLRAAAPPIVSELYTRDGVNELSLLAGDVQLLWSTRFAPSEPEFYQAQVASRSVRRRLSRPAQRILDRLEVEFERTLPLSGALGGPPPELRLERWTAAGTERIEDPARARAMAVRLRRQWMRYVDRERTPKEESSLRATPR